MSHWLRIFSCSEIIFPRRRSWLIIQRNNLINVNSQITDTFESFEYVDARPRCLQGITILVIYRPPGRSSYDLFYEEFSKGIEQTAVSPGG